MKSGVNIFSQCTIVMGMNNRFRRSFFSSFLLCVIHTNISHKKIVPKTRTANAKDIKKSLPHSFAYRYKKKYLPINDYFAEIYWPTTLCGVHHTKNNNIINVGEIVRE